jgi:hypothetical protein
MNNPRESDLRTCPVRVLVKCDGQCATCGDPFSRHLERASAIVATWPEWKRNILGTEPEPAPVNQYDEQYEGRR